MVEVSHEKMMEIAQYALTRLDGGWFLLAAKKLGADTAYELDADVWEHFAYVLAKKLKQDLIPEPVWPGSFIDAIDILGRLLKTEGREVLVEGNTVTLKVKDCETQRMIAKAGVADCGIATVQSNMGIIRGLFGKDAKANIRHVKNLNHGDDCCEVRITYEIQSC
jgi:hypothetical protein